MAKILEVYKEDREWEVVQKLEEEEIDNMIDLDILNGFVEQQTNEGRVVIQYDTSHVKQDSIGWMFRNL